MIPGIVASAAPVPAPTPDHELPHRYWRLAIIGNSSNVSALSRFEMRASAGGADLTPGYTTISSGAWTDIANLFDGDNATFGYTNSSATRSAGYSVGKDFGATDSNWPVVREVFLRNRASGGSGAESQGPVVMAVQYSDNNSTWVTAWSFSCADWSAFNTERTFTKTSPRERLILDIANPPTDSGPHALAFAAIDGATVSAGRFIFDGASDGYASTSIPSTAIETYRLPWGFEIEVDAVMASNSGLDGIVCFGGTSLRLIVINSDGALQVYVNEQGSPSINEAGVFSPSTPCDIKIKVDGTVITAYKDGVLIDTASVSGAHNTTQNSIYLGQDPAVASTRVLTGSFAGVRLTIV